MMKKNLLLALVLSIVPLFVFTQNLDKMSVEKHTAFLIELARNSVKKYAPGYYREYGEPTIERLTIEEDCKVPEELKEEGVRSGRPYYRVTFPYDKKKEFFMYGYSATVSIWASTGKLAVVMVGNGFGRRFKEKPKKTDKEVEILPYEKQERPKLNKQVFPDFE